MANVNIHGQPGNRIVIGTSGSAGGSLLLGHPQVRVGLVRQTARHEWSTPISYVGKANYGTSETATGWRITRITVATDGTTTTATALGKWSDRTVLTYN